MITETIEYNFEDSLLRIDQMLNLQIVEENASASVPLLNEIPAKSGNITNCSVMQVKMEISSSHNYSQLIKVIRVFLSEAVAILSSDSNCVDIQVLGDRLTAVFTTPFKRNIEMMIDKAAMINSLAEVVSRKAKSVGLPSISVVIGMDYGEAMLMRLGIYNTDESMPKALAWMGKPVEKAQKLIDTPEHKWNIWISFVVYNNLSEDYTKFFHNETEWGCYGANIINTYMRNWLNKQ